MPRVLEEVERDAMVLPLRDRELLMAHLLASLDEGEEAGAEEAWLAEADRRYKEYQAGRMSAVPAEEVFAEARARLAQRKNR